MLNKTNLIIILSTLMLLTSCSAYKAAENEGITVEDIKKCKNKHCFLSHGMSVSDKYNEEDGTFVEIIKAKARKSGLNYFRAAGHGALSVFSLGLWEVVGTPLEGAISNNRGYIIAKVSYPSRQSDTILKSDIYNATGTLIYTYYAAEDKLLKHVKR